MNKKTICIIHHATMQGGGAKSLIDLANMLNDDYHVIICVPKSDSAMKIELQQHNIEIYECLTRIPTLMSFSGGPPLISKSLIKTVINLRKVETFCNEIMALHPDAIFYNSIVSIISAKYFPVNVKKFCIVRETLLNKITLKYYRNTLEKYFTGVCAIANSELKKLNLTKVYTLEVPDSVPMDKVETFSNYDWKLRQKKRIKLLYMGGAQKIKGGRVLLKSLDYIKGDFELTIAGNYPQRHYGFIWCLKHITSINYWLYLNKMHKLLEKQEKKYNINCIGYSTDVSKLIKECDIMIFPSINVHQPRPCIEAGYFGKPVILTDYIETREFFKNNYNALTFDPGDYVMLASKIDELADDVNKYRFLSKNNFDMSFKIHNYDLIKNNLLIFMKKLL